MQNSPFAMSRKVADVFVVMKGEVPDSIFKNFKQIYNLPSLKHNLK